MKVDKVTIRTNCVHCGSPLEVEAKVHNGKEFFNDDWLRRDDIYPEDPYTCVHLLCDNCDILKGFEDEAHSNHNSRS